MADARDEKVRARYRELATEEPSAAIDAAIRAAARRAVGSAPGERSRPMRWAVPASVAAVLFLSFGVVMRLDQEVPPLEISTLPREAATAPSAPEAMLRKEVAPEVKKEGPAQDRARAPAAKPEPPRPTPAKKVAEEKIAEKPASPVPAPAPRPSPAPPPAAQAPPPASVPAAPPAIAADKASGPQAFSDSAVARAPAEEQRNVEPKRRDEAAGALGLAAPAPEPGAKTEGAPAPARAAAARVQEREAPWPDTIEKKLERIETLRKAGRDREADEAIARFRREHPDYKIPDATWERIKPK